MEWEELFLSDEFAAYRKRQAELVAKTVHGILASYQPDDAKFLKGAMEMGFRLIRLPMEIAGERTKLRSQISKQIEQDMADVSACLIARSFQLNEDD